jgi:hypothetical protein
MARAKDLHCVPWLATNCRLAMAVQLVGGSLLRECMISAMTGRTCRLVAMGPGDAAQTSISK